LDRAIEIDQYVMILASSGCVRHDALKYGSDDVGLDAQAGLFEDFANHRIFEPLTSLNYASGQRPATRQRLIPAFDQQHPRPIQYQGANAQNRTQRVAAALSHTSSLRLRKIAHSSTPNRRWSPQSL
jgi:hypothetical protein